MSYITSVTVCPSSISLAVGEWFYASVCVCPYGGDSDVIWSSCDPSVASVSEGGGYIYANSVGSTYICATAQDGSGHKSCMYVQVTEKVPIESISLKYTSLLIEKGYGRSISGYISPSNATNKNLNWSSSNTDVATVTNGYVTAINKGNATITATAADGKGATASCTVTVTTNKLVTDIKVNPSSKELKLGDSMFLGATVCPKDAVNRTITWSSSNTNIATVNPESGLVCVSTEGKGDVIITATANDGSGTVGKCNLTITVPIKITKILIDEYYVYLNKGCTQILKAFVLPSNATFQKVKWTSSNPSVATIDQNTGEITAKSGGRAIIYASARDGSGIEASCDVEVKQTVVSSAEESSRSISNDPVDAYTGAHLLNSTIMPLFGGQNIKLTAHYDSTLLGSGELGSGWYHNYEKRIVLNGQTAYVYNSPSIFSRYTAESCCCNKFTCNTPSKNRYVLKVAPSDNYEYVIDCNSTKTEYYNDDGKLVKIVDHQGFETLITHNSSSTTITDAVSGKKIYLQKDSNGRVVRVYDDDGREAIFTYNGNLLSSIRDINGNEITYTYDKNNRLISGIDSRGICYFENTYDDYGRILTQKDALNHISCFDYGEGNNDTSEGATRIATNRNGKNSVRVYNDDGLLIKHTDENGNSKHYEYDERNNITKETDANGNSITKEYNRFNKPISITDHNGNITSFTYDSKGNVTEISYPAIDGVTPVEKFTYNNRNQMVKHIDTRGTTTVYTYDSNGMPLTKKVGNKNAITYSYVGGLLKSQTDARGYVTRYSHNEIGQITSKTDSDNKVTEYTYDKSGNLLKTIYANGKAVENTYDGNYQKTSFTDANGNKTEYSYNGNLKNTSITLPNGHMIRYEYDNEDRLIKTFDTANNASEITYDDVGRVKSKLLSDGATIVYDYDAVGNVVKETNSKGAVITRTYDKLGNVLTVTDDNGNTTSYEYNAISKVTKTTNAVSGVTVYKYSPAGDLLSETDALGNKKTYTYDAFGNRLTATDAKNNITTYTYDQNNNLLTVKDALNNVTAYTYNSLNQCIAVSDALGNTVHYGYDALGRKTSVTDAKGNTFTTEYDGNGNTIKTTDANGNTISEIVYNALNKPLTVIDAMGKATTYTYNKLGLVETVTDPMNNVSEYSYNSRGQNTSVRDAANGESKATYDLLGNITKLEGPLGGATEYTYDDMGRLISESTVSGGTVQYTYNALNVRNKVTNARGEIREFSYDALGRITGYTSPEGTVSYTYDKNGNVLGISDSHGTITRTYDALNRITSCTDSYNKILRYEYDAVGNLSKIIYPDNTAVTYAYDANRNLVRVTDWANRVTSYTYDANNRVIGVTKPDGSVTTTVYDNKQRVTSTVERTASGTVIIGFEYIYDDLSRIIEEKVLANSTKICYTYDSLSRVIAKTVKNISDDSVISTETFTYDAAGNVTGAPDSCFRYDTNNRLVIFNENTVSYDLDGNMLDNGDQCFVYDSANRLIGVDDHIYTYNAENVRIRKFCTDEDTVYTYDTNCKLSKLLCKTTNGITTKYVYGRGLIGEEVSNSFKTYHFDCRGSTIAITDASGNITDTFVYNTYGKLIGRTGTSAIIFGYNGRDGVVTDDNGLIYMRARYYSPDMRRFVNADIVAGQISNAVTLNRFAYANGNPVSFVDPFGLSVWSWLKEKGKQVKNAWNTYVAEPVKEKIITPIVKSVIEPTIELGKKVVDYVATDLGENLYSATKKTYNSITGYTVGSKEIAESVSKENLTKKREEILGKAPDTIQYAIESVTVDIGFGAGIGADFKAYDAQVGALVREDFISFKKDSGSTEFQFGEKSEIYHGVSAYGAFFGRGEEDFTALGSEEYNTATIIEPNQDLNIGTTFKAYYGLGFSFSIGFDIDHFLTKIIFS